MKTEKEIKEKLEELENPDICWQVAGIELSIPSAECLKAALKWVLGN